MRDPHGRPHIETGSPSMTRPAAESCNSISVGRMTVVQAVTVIMDVVGLPSPRLRHRPSTSRSGSACPSGSIHLSPLLSTPPILGRRSAWHLVLTGVRRRD